jgi:hypothetical protein
VCCLIFAETDMSIEVKDARGGAFEVFYGDR